MDGTRPVGAHGGKEILALQIVGKLIQALPIACEEDGACAWLIAYANDIALDVGRAVWCWGKGLVKPSVTC